MAPMELLAVARCPIWAAQKPSPWSSELSMAGAAVCLGAVESCVSAGDAVCGVLLVASPGKRHWALSSTSLFSSHAFLGTNLTQASFLVKLQVFQILLYFLVPDFHCKSG